MPKVLWMAERVFAVIVTAGVLLSAGALQVGVTHVTDWEPWSPHQESVARAVDLLKEGVITWQNQGVVGGGGMWLPSPDPPSAPNDYDWSHLDYRVQAMRNSSSVDGRMVLRLFDAPAWMCNTSWHRETGNAPLSRNHYDDFAEFCGAIAARYPDVTHFEVWNELNGFISNWTWNRLDGMQVASADYTDLFIKVSTAIKRVNPGAKVGGPYVPITQGLLPPGSSSACSGPWGAINPSLLEFVKYFIRAARGHYDFFTMDGHLAFEAYQLPNGSVYKRPTNNDPFGATQVFPDSTRWVREHSGLAADIPIWWSEIYPVPCVDTGMYGPATELWPLEQQISVYTKALEEIAAPDLGVEVALNWAAMANENCIVGMYNDTNTANGGMPTPFYTVVKNINQRNTRSGTANTTSHATVSALPGTVATSKGGGKCASDRDCHYAGVCGNAGVCVCDAAWTGSDCGQLHLLPARAGSGYPNVPASSQLPSTSPFTWGGAEIFADGVYHGFFTEFVNHCPMTYGTWATATHIRHATSHTPDGPWNPQDIAVPVAAGNPVITRAPDGTYLLYFTNHRWNGTNRNCTGPVSTWKPPVYCNASQYDCDTGISLAHATSLSGPWSVIYDVVNFSSTNPGAPVFAPNGSLIMAYKTWTKDGRCIGIVAADSWKNFPYRSFPISPHTVDSCVGSAVDIEDPSNLWRDLRGNVHMLFHEHGYGGAAASVDGITAWDYNTSRRAYDYDVEYEDGTTVPCTHREEPKVLLNAEASQPLFLITQCTLPTRLPNTCPSPQHPTGEPQYVTRIIMQPINTQL
eukprot:m.367915 g.367915  ORF g.367915 m.367915 type:complete len:802 (-) comp20839_c0_seq2:64-2469(-)